MSAVRRSVAATALAVVAAATVVLGGPARAESAGPSCAGVEVVIDHGALSGGTDETCVGVHDDAADDVTASGHTLAGTQQFPTLVCRIDGQPADQPCAGAPPADAYWALYWTDGRTGRWAYASLGAYSLDVPKGGAVAFVWQDSTTSTPPDVVAPRSVPPTHGVSPTPSATLEPTPKPAAASTAPQAAPSSSPSPSVAPKKRHRPGRTSNGYPILDHETITVTPTQGAHSSKPTTTTASGSGGGPARPAPGGGLPGWVAPAVLIVVVAGSGYAVRRRRAR